jgi:hypothetical protein
MADCRFGFTRNDINGKAAAEERCGRRTLRQKNAADAMTLR